MGCYPNRRRVNPGLMCELVESVIDDHFLSYRGFATHCKDRRRVSLTDDSKTLLVVYICPMSRLHQERESDLILGGTLGRTACRQTSSCHGKSGAIALRLSDKRSDAFLESVFRESKGLVTQLLDRTIVHVVGIPCQGLGETTSRPPSRRRDGAER